MYVNYTIPSGTVNDTTYLYAKYTDVDGSGGVIVTDTFDIPETCFNNTSDLQFKYTSYSKYTKGVYCAFVYPPPPCAYANYLQAQCYGNSQWNDIFTTTNSGLTASNILYEEAINWTVDAVSNVSDVSLYFPFDNSNNKEEIVTRRNATTFTSNIVSGKYYEGVSHNHANSTDDKIIIYDVPVSTNMTYSFWFNDTNNENCFWYTHMFNSTMGIKVALQGIVLNVVIFSDGITNDGRLFWLNGATLPDFNDWRHIEIVIDGSNITSTTGVRVFIDNVDMEMSPAIVGSDEPVLPFAKVGTLTIGDLNNLGTGLGSCTTGSSSYNLDDFTIYDNNVHNYTRTSNYINYTTNSNTNVLLNLTASMVNISLFNSTEVNYVPTITVS